MLLNNIIYSALIKTDIKTDRSLRPVRQIQFLLTEKSGLVHIDDLALVVCSTSFADTMRHCKGSAFAALNQIRHAHLPVRTTFVTM